jgi:menaquinone-dependent protoporphyrinogen oxidase
MKVLVAAATKYGATGEIAEAIGDVLAECGFDATVIHPNQVGTIEDYDAVVLGSAVYAGHWLDEAKELVDRSSDAFPTRPVWLFSSGPVGDPSRKMVQKMGEDPVDVAEILETTKAREHRVFAGKLEKKNLSFPERAILIAFRGMEGDFRDWTEIKAWASGIADALRPGS